MRPGAIYGQSEIKIAGQAIDQISGGPVPGAMILIEGLGRHAIADGSGQFYFTDLPAGNYEIVAMRIGYSSGATVAVDVNAAAPARVTILLIPTPVVVAGQTVIAPRTSGISIQSRGNMTIVQAQPGEIKSLEGLVRQIPELELVDSGPRKLLRMRGSQLNSVVIMLDGRILNSVLTSQGDISAIPLGSVTRIEIVNGGDYKSEGLAGSVNFITDRQSLDNKISSNAERGSFGMESYSIDLANCITRNIDIGVNLNDSYNRGDFKFIDPRDSVEVRENNSAHDIMLFGKLRYETGRSEFNLKTRYFQRNAGVPGPVFQLMPDAQSKSAEKEIYAGFSRQLPAKLAVNLTAGITSRRADFDSPRTPTNFIAYKTRFDEDARDARFQISTRGRFGFECYFTLRYESLHGLDLLRPAAGFGRHSRLVDSEGSGLTIRLPDIAGIVDESTLNLGIKREGGYGDDFWGPSGNLRVNFKFPASPGVDVSYFRSRRLPDLTDLYWKEDVFATPNPDLMPEKSNGYNFGLDLRLERYGPYSLRTSRFSTVYDDIIVWRRWAGDKFKPVNLSRARVDGWEISTTIRPFSGPVTAFWNASYIKPLNKEDEPAHHDKYLTFRPIGTQNAGIEVKYHGFEIKLTGRHLGRRYITEENTKSLAPVDLADLSIDYTRSLHWLLIESSFSIMNIGNIQYEILDRQPERPREYRLRIGISKTGSLL